MLAHSLPSLTPTPLFFHLAEQSTPLAPQASLQIQVPEAGLQQTLDELRPPPAAARLRPFASPQLSGLLRWDLRLLPRRLSQHPGPSSSAAGRYCQGSREESERTSLVRCAEAADCGLHSPSTRIPLPPLPLLQPQPARTQLMTTLHCRRFGAKMLTQQTQQRTWPA